MAKDTDFIVEQFAYAVADYIDAKREEEKARKEYEGMSWGYHGFTYFQRIDAAKEKLTATFKEAVVAVLPYD